MSTGDAYRNQTSYFTALKTKTAPLTTKRTRARWCSTTKGTSIPSESARMLTSARPPGE